jgi:N-acetylglucosaminyl-diphospho-decaprenol L-rhamnosyltransferase
MSDAAVTNLIVTYNSLRDVSALLADLRLYAPRSPIVIIDNASADGTAAAIRRDFPEVQLSANPANIGYARAVNQGFALCDSEYVFLLNPDIRIASAQAFLELQGCLDASPLVAAAAPLQFKSGGHGPHLNFTWSYWTPPAFGLYISHRLGRPRPPGGPISVRFLNAGCLFLRRSAFNKVGRLNEKYFLYGEEPDLFLKFWRHGLECRLLPSVSVIHNRERSLGTVPFLSRLRFRLLGGLNIGDAVLRGLSNLLLDRILGRHPA